VTVSAPGAARVCEPSLRVDVRGNCYVGGIRGVPAGVDLWRFDLDPASPGYDPQLRNPTYLGQPDAFAAQDTSGGLDGGGYIDVDHANGYVYVSHMSSSALFVSRSTDAGATWSTFTADNSTSHHHLFDPIKVGDDGTVYVAWSDDHAVYLAHSSDHGVTWAP